MDNEKYKELEEEAFNRIKAELEEELEEKIYEHEEAIINRIQRRILKEFLDLYNVENDIVLNEDEMYRKEHDLDSEVMKLKNKIYKLEEFGERYYRIESQ